MAAAWPRAALLARLGLGRRRHRAGSARPTIRITAVLVREPDRVGGLFSLGPRLLDRRHARCGPGAAARRPRPLRVQGGPARGDRRGRVRGRPAAELARCRLARAQPARRPAPGHPRHRPARDLPDAGGPDRAAHRRPRHRADHRDPPRAPDRRPSPPSRAWAPAAAQVFAIYLGQVMLLAVAGVVLGLALGLLLPLAVRLVPDGRAADRPRSRRLCRPAAARGAGRAAHHLRVRGVAAGDRARGVAGPACFGRWSRRRGAGRAGPISLLLALAVAGAGGAGDPGRAAARRSAPGSCSPWPWRRSCSGASPACLLLAARRLPHRGGFALRLAIANLHRPGSPSPRVIVALGAGVTAARGGGGARHQPATTRWPCACRPARRRSI